MRPRMIVVAGPPGSGKSSLFSPYRRGASSTGALAITRETGSIIASRGAGLARHALGRARDGPPIRGVAASPLLDRRPYPLVHLWVV